VGICNPAFDVTPAKYIAAIITERGVLRAPYAESLKNMETASRRLGFLEGQSDIGLEFFEPLPENTI
jgi:hypothetical protein